MLAEFRGDVKPLFARSNRQTTTAHWGVITFGLQYAGYMGLASAGRGRYHGPWHSALNDKDAGPWANSATQ